MIEAKDHGCPICGYEEIEPGELQMVKIQLPGWKRAEMYLCKHCRGAIIDEYVRQDPEKFGIAE